MRHGERVPDSTSDAARGGTPAALAAMRVARSGSGGQAIRDPLVEVMGRLVHDAGEHTSAEGG